jgi:hypothetical protein
LDDVRALNDARPDDVRARPDGRFAHRTRALESTFCATRMTRFAVG